MSMTIKTFRCTFSTENSTWRNVYFWTLEEVGVKDLKNVLTFNRLFMQDIYYKATEVWEVQEVRSHANFKEYLC